ncbi:MAG: PEP-CTERM sorting domain-containing protein [Planctomycetota bacterium]
MQRLGFMLGSAALVGLATWLAPTAAMAVSLGSIDTFDNSSEGWAVGSNGVQPSFENGTSFDGQPGFLRHFSDGGGPNGRWIMWSEESDWTGDYLAAGVEGISLWADGRTGDDIVFWLGFDGPGGWFFTPGQTIVTDNDWEKFSFDLDPSSLIYAANSGGTQVAEDTLANVNRFEIFAGNGGVSFAGRGDLLRSAQSNNVIWFDNIAAVPEPTTAALLLLTAPLALLRRR